MKSMLFVPGDSDKKLSKGLESGADALIIDLEDSVVPDRKKDARQITRAFLGGVRGGPKLFVRINPLISPYAVDDLAAVTGGAPDGIVLPKCASASDIVAVSHYLSALEAREGLPPAVILILPIVTETAGAMFTLGSYAEAGTRLCGMMWGCEDLAADVGASVNRTDDKQYLPAFELARSLCLFAAAAAGVPAIDTVFTDFKNMEELEREARTAERMGFTAKAAIHPGQIDIINRAFTPNDAAIAWARKVVDAFVASPQLGVVGVDGKMLDRPHLRAAERVLERAGLPQ
jgi:citrate lyase subunit beta/citryl-CoA lyase